MTRRAAPPLHPRARVFDFAGVPTHWCAGDAFRSRLFDAFSTLLPVGERFFIEALRRAAEELADPALDDAIEQFVRQEALHSREHRRYNERLREEGIDLDAWDRSLKRTMWRVLQVRDPRIPLAITVGVEHLTATVGRAVLGRRVLADADPILEAFWSWHSAEEIEHKSAAFEVYERLGGGPGLRRMMMGWGLLLLSIRLGARFVDLLRRDGVLFDLATYRSGVRFLRSGFAEILVADLVAYFRRDFHPWDRDDYDLVESWERAQPALTAAVSP